MRPLRVELGRERPMAAFVRETLLDVDDGRDRRNGARPCVGIVVVGIAELVMSPWSISAIIHIGTAMLAEVRRACSFMHSAIVSPNSRPTLIGSQKM